MAKRRRNKNTRDKGFTPTANPELAQAMRNLRRSNAAQPHVPKPFKGTRSERKKKVVQEQKKESP